VEFIIGGESMRKIRGIRYLSNNVVYDEMDSPVGKLTIIASPEELHAVLWDIDRKDAHYEKIISALTKSENKTILQTKKQLTEYFQGKRKIFDLPIALHGTDFQIQVWNELLKIPYSKTVSYAEQAEKIGNRNKARAVGAANGLNPISIIIPCHRVIGSNGSLVGFGGGIDKKAYLLQLEQTWGLILLFRPRITDIRIPFCF
jgi:methylated-DNA-[protein]-cysteine S-methyltransferase